MRYDITETFDSYLNMIPEKKDNIINLFNNLNKLNYTYGIPYVLDLHNLEEELLDIIRTNEGTANDVYTIIRIELLDKVYDYFIKHKIILDVENLTLILANRLLEGLHLFLTLDNSLIDMYVEILSSSEYCSVLEQVVEVFLNLTDIHENELRHLIEDVVYNINLTWLNYIAKYNTAETYPITQKVNTIIADLSNVDNALLNTSIIKDMMSEGYKDLNGIIEVLSYIYDNIEITYKNITDIVNEIVVMSYIYKISLEEILSNFNYKLFEDEYEVAAEEVINIKVYEVNKKLGK